MSIPITLLTGFLGSGKTTLLNRLVRRPELRDALVLVNEVGEISVDHDLVQEIDERSVVLPSGCVCCALREDLIDVLDDESLMRGRGHVLLETSGLADPTPLVATLLARPDLRERFHLNQVVVTLDAGRGPTVCALYPEAVKQLALADVVVITKCDQVTASRVREAEELARAVAPEAARVRAVRGELDGELAGATRHAVPPAETSHEHTHGIRTFTVESRTPASYSELALWLSMMSQLNGDRLLRFKGLLRVRHEDTPVVVQSVQHVVYPSYNLPAWPDGVARTRLVGITHRMPPRLFEDTVASLRAIVGAAGSTRAQVQ